MTGVQGPTPDFPTKVINKQGKKQQMVSRDDLMNAIRKLQLPQSQGPGSPYMEQMYPQVGGSNG